jgi:hypothetical protein
MIYNPSLQWSWSAGEITSPSFTTFSKMQKHFVQNKPNSADEVAVKIGDRVWAFYDLDFNQISVSNSLVNKYFYGAMA